MTEILFLLVILALTKAVASDLCPLGWIHDGNSCYHIGRESETWTEAMKMCEIHRGYLVALETDDEYLRVKSMMSTYSAGQDYWIAGSDWAQEGHWVWEPLGTKISTDHWYPIDPNGHSAAQCMAMNRITGFRWTDESCTLHKNYVCELELRDAVGGGSKTGGGVDLLG